MGCRRSLRPRQNVPSQLQGKDFTFDCFDVIYLFIIVFFSLYFKGCCNRFLLGGFNPCSTFSVVRLMNSSERLSVCMYACVYFLNKIFFKFLLFFYYIFFAFKGYQIKDNKNT